MEGVDTTTLQAGVELYFEMGSGKDGRKQAVRVRYPTNEQIDEERMWSGRDKRVIR
jgi:hypothetical protein